MIMRGWLLWVRLKARVEDRDEVGASVVETAIVAAGLAALAIGVVTAVQLLVSEHMTIPSD